MVQIFYMRKMFTSQAKMETDREHLRSQTADV